MTQKAEQSQAETVDTKSMSLEELKNHINSEVAKAEADNPAEKSESEVVSKKEEAPKKEAPSKEEPTEEKEKAEKAASETEEPSDKQKEKKEESKPLDYEKSYKELQRKFTDNNTKYKGEINELKEQLKALTDLVKGKTSESTDEPSLIDEIREKSPETAKLFERFEKQIEAKYSKLLKEKIEPLQSTMSSSKEAENAAKFTQGLDAFMASDTLKVYEQDLIGILNERFDSQDALEEAVRKDPRIFADAKRELAARLLDGTIETKSANKAAKASKEEKAEKKKEEIEKTETEGKPKGSAPVEGELTVAASKNIPLDQLRKKLPVKAE